MANWFLPKRPYTGTGYNVPKERRLKKIIDLVFLNREGKKIGPPKKDK